jgi:acyl carrier protein
MKINHPSYSEDALIADLRRWWDEQVADEEDPFADPPRPRAGTIFEVVPVVDSLGVVSALVTIEKHLDFEIPPQIIKPGGYRNFEEMIADLLPKVRALLIKRKKEAA